MHILADKETSIRYGVFLTVRMCEFDFVLLGSVALGGLKGLLVAERDLRGLLLSMRLATAVYKSCNAKSPSSGAGDGSKGARRRH